jgi:hypothetical protein
VTCASREKESIFCAKEVEKRGKHSIERKIVSSLSLLLSNWNILVLQVLMIMVFVLLSAGN